MKIFETGKDSYDSSINFVDTNNVFVGYSMSQDCCEHADWFISKTEDNDVIDDNGIIEKLDDYSFDKEYFEEVEPKKSDWGTVLDAGGMVRFKLVSKDKPDLFLHLYNSHNGYYSHGFEMKIDDKQVREGCL
jgi:hypothetical protein